MLFFPVISMKTMTSTADENLRLSKNLGQAKSMN